MLEDLEQEVRPQEKQLSEEVQMRGALVSPRMFLRLTVLAGSRLSHCTEQRQFGEAEEAKERCLVCVCAADRGCCGADGPVGQAGSGERQEGGRGRRSGSDGAEVIGQTAVSRAVRLQAVTILCFPPQTAAGPAGGGPDGRGHGQKGGSGGSSTAGGGALGQDPHRVAAGVQ